MTTCSKCRSAEAGVQLRYARMSLCPPCFTEFYRARVRRTVEEFRMFKEGDDVGVAVSGGKDSAALLHALRLAYPRLKLKALHVDLGIPGYSEHCRSKVEELARMLGVELLVFDLQREVGVGMSDFRRTALGRRVCSACGTVKRRAFELLAMRAGVRVLATGHSLDDVVGAMFMDFLHGRWEQLVRLKPVLPPLAEGMALKVKPLVKTPEEEDALYCLYSGIPTCEVECPFAAEAGVRRGARLLRLLAKENPQARHLLLKRFLEVLPLLEGAAPKPALVKCRVCGLPSSSEVCAFCRRLAMLTSAKG